MMDGGRVVRTYLVVPDGGPSPSGNRQYQVMDGSERVAEAVWLFGQWLVTRQQPGEWYGTVSGPELGLVLDVVLEDR